MPLETELRTFEARKRELLATDAGKFALVREGEVVGTYDTQNDAIQAGYEKFGNTAFLVKAITEMEEPERFVSNVFVAP